MSMRIIVFLCLVLLPAGYTSAVFYNNTETIEIGDGEPDISPDSGGNGGGDSSAGGGSTQNGDGGSGGSGDGGEDTTVPMTIPTPPAARVDTNNNGIDDSQEQSLLDTLLKAGAILGLEWNSGGANTQASSGEGYSIRIIGAQVRSALQGNINLKDFLMFWRKGKGEATVNEYGLIAASTALRDANVQEISFTASKFEIIYRSRGYLLMVIPWSFPVRVGIVHEATTLTERVQVKFPWYGFLIRKFFTKQGLQKDIDEVIVEVRESNTDATRDGTMLLFERVSEFLRTKVGTVSESVLLGTPLQ